MLRNPREKGWLGVPEMTQEWIEFERLRKSSPQGLVVGVIYRFDHRLSHCLGQNIWQGDEYLRFIH